MIHFLIGSWFLLALVAGLAVGVVWPGPLAQATAWADPKVVVVLALFLMAWTLPGRSLAAELRRPAAALWALMISYGFLPAAAWFLGAWLPPDFHVGTLIMIAGPCTLASAALWTRLAAGNEATALLVTILSTAMSWLITTAWLTAATHTEVALDPAAMMRALLLGLVLPVSCGQLCRSVPLLLTVATRYKAPLGVLAQLLILLIVLRAAADVGERLGGSNPSLTPTDVVVVSAFCVLLHVAAVVLAWWSSAWLGFDRPRRIAVAFAASQKTLPVALLIFDEYFRKQFPLAILPILIYHAGQLLCDTAIARRLRAAAAPGTDDEMTRTR